MTDCNGAVYAEKKIDDTQLLGSIIHVWFMAKTILNCHDQLDQVLTMTKTR